MLEITPALRIDEDEMEISFVRASGPGGQNVNKVATAAQLRFDVRGSRSLPEETRERLLKLAGKRLTTEGVLVIEARRYRTQEQNRSDALQRFTALVRRASEPPRPRKKTQPTQASQEERLREKRRRSALKESRRARTED
ncbi:MAG: alternative ribosome rescue aminoacyl-tRNA hydrolase ArfB [Bacteroidota bacterium]